VASTVCATIAGVLIADIQRRFFVETLVVVFCLLLLVLIGTLRPVNRMLRKLIYRSGSLPRDFIDTKVRRGSPDSELPVTDQFTTQGRSDYFYEVGFRPTRLIFRNLGDHVVNETNLPAEIPCRRGWLMISRFTAHGFIIREEDTVGDSVELEIHD
jgi:hypothetical protein